MALQIGDIAHDFTAQSTEGLIRFHEWIGDSWAVLFSHPKDFTPVCTTELGYMGELKTEFDRRRVKIVGLSVDPVEHHIRWAADYRRHPGAVAELPDDRRHGSQRVEAIRNAARNGRGHERRTDCSRQSNGPERLRHRP